MSIIKVSDLAYCRMQTPDLDRSEQFLRDFGLLPAGLDGPRRLFRGTAPSQYCYVIEKGPRQFLGCAFQAKSRADLEALSKSEGRLIEHIDAPGGGLRVRLTDPNGYAIDVVHGIESAAPVEIERCEVNTAAHPLRRAGKLLRLPKNQPTPIKRLAHVVFATPKLNETIDWYRHKLGLISSDEVVVGPEKKRIGAFMRVDDGSNFVDHHAVFVVASPQAGLQHLSFEAQDVDAVFADHHYLQHLGRYEHFWGIGRHLLGSQLFDYWSDPWGYAHEHWADSDRLNADAPTAVWDAREGLVTQWGEEPSERFRNCAQP
jgi:hypothetical protein